MGVYHIPALSNLYEQIDFNLLRNAEISNCNADTRTKLNYFKVNKVKPHIHLQHFLWLRGNYF